MVLYWPTLRDLASVTLGVIAVTTAATLQMVLVLGIHPTTLSPTHYLMPASLGAVLGALAAVRQRTLADRRIQAYALETERQRVQSLHDAIAALADERLRMLGHAHGALQRAERQSAAGLQAGACAHDLRNLLNVVAHIADMVRHQEHTEDDLLLLEEVTMRAAERSQELLTLAREGHRSSATHLDVAEALRGVLPLLERIVGDAHPWEVQLPEGLVAWAHEADLELALLHLVRNACEASPPGGPVSIRAHAAMGHVVIEVTDHGHGMTPHTLDRGRFPTRRRGENLHGLGLALVHDLMTNCGGSLELQSAPGLGTTARLLLRTGPPTRAEASDPPAPDRSPSSPMPTP